MTDTIVTDVLICGAGAAGLTLSIELARRGVAFRLIDSLDAPFPGSRGKGIQPRSQEIFEDIGVLDKLVAIGGFYPQPRAYRPDGSYESAVSEPVVPAPGEPYHLPLLVPQFLTERILRARLTELGGRLEFGRTLTGFEQDADGVTVLLACAAGTETVRAKYLIGADGGRSLVRHALNIGFPGRTLGVRAIVADVMLTGLGREAWHRFHESDLQRQISLCPLAGTPLFQLQAPIPLEGEADLSVEGLAALVAARTGREDIVIQSVAWASAYSMNARLADRYRVGRVLLAGDAAHVHPPTGGQGLNTSVQDSYNLGWKLAAVIAGADDGLLDTYQEERRPVAAAMLGLSTKLLEAAGRGDSRRGREVQQLDISYAGASLALELPARSGGLAAGDRAPDAPIGKAAGQPGRLFQVFSGSHWTLLACETGSDALPPRPGLHIHTVGPAGDLVDTGGHVRDAYGWQPGDLTLVRPDGYVGAIAGPDQAAALEVYLRRVGLAAEAVTHG